MARYADVILPLPLDEAFTYALPEHLRESVRVGCRLVVPFGARKIYAAVVVALSDNEPEGKFKTREALELLDESPVLLPQQLRLWRWMADYYLCTQGEVCKAALPGSMKKDRSRPDAAKTRASGIKKEPQQTQPDRLPTLPLVLQPLSEAQRRVKDKIAAHFREGDVCLLHGVTGSGKTEVYTHLIGDAIGRGEQVLYLLPEIVLTTQLVDRLRRVFGPRLGVYHSKYSDTERVGVWRKQLSDQPYDIIVGVRSSVFLPFRRLGLVVVDEEHETSYKQQEPAPRYHARNVALMLARMCGAKTLLGTATPSVESYFLARQGKYGLALLPERYSRVELPEIEKVDVRDMQRRKAMAGPFSSRLLAAMRNALDGGEQVILFQNRRGFSPYVECQECAWVPRCHRCDVSLTLHRNEGHMSCHYCGATYAIPAACPNCGGKRLANRGYGTERVEDDIQKMFPEARIARMDQDTTRNRRAYEQMLRGFERGDTDILVGTQMVAKGLDIDRVSVVGILNADTMLNIPDFRSHERAFQMLAQVAGRAGRRGKKGLVILQTKTADASVISQVMGNDYEAMYQEQMEERGEFLYPPYCRLIDIYIKHKDPRVADSMAAELASHLRRDFGDRVLGPEAPHVGMVQKLHIRKMVLKTDPAASLAAMRARLRGLQAHMLSRPGYKAAQLYYDADPY